MEQVDSVLIVMARVLGLLWMRNPLAIVHHKEQPGLVPACPILSGRQQPESLKKGDAMSAAEPRACTKTDKSQKSRTVSSSTAGYQETPDNEGRWLRR